MRITDLLSKDGIELNVNAKDKNDIINKMTKLMLKTGRITDLNAYTELVLKREEEGSTGVGEGIAIPHGKGDCVTEPGLVAMVVPNGVEYDALDGKPVNLLFMIAAPNTSDNVHLDVLSRLSTMLMDADFKNKLISAKSKEEFLNIINETENVKIVVDATKNLLVQALKYNPFLIKPNNEELGEIFGVEIHTKEDAYVYGKKLKEMGAQNVLVSMGKIGAALIDEAGQEYFIKSPEGKRVNTVGSGDSMVAGFIAGFLKYNNYNDALRMGVSAGSASALSKYLATKEEVYNLFNNI